MQNFSNPPNELLLNKSYGRPENETARYSDSDSWDTDFEDEGIESAELYGDVDSRKVDHDRENNQYNVTYLTKTVAASLHIGVSDGSSSVDGGGGYGRPQLKNDSEEKVSTKRKPTQSLSPAGFSAQATSSTLRNKAVSGLPKPPCQASEHVRQVIGNLGQLWPPDAHKSGLQNQNDDYEPIHSGGEAPPEEKKSFLHSSSAAAAAAVASMATTSSPGPATPTRPAPPRPKGPPAAPFIHGASAAAALSRLAEAAARNHVSKPSQNFGARTSRTLPTETKEKCAEEKRAATLPPALCSPAPAASPGQPAATPPTAPLLVSNRPLPPTPAAGAPPTSAPATPPAGAAQTRTSPSSPSFLVNALQCRPWFHEVDRRRAEELVRNGVDGYFLVRPSSQSTNALTLTMWYNSRVYNISIRLRPDGRIALGTAKPNEQSFATVEEMVANYQSENLVLFSGGIRTGLTVLTTHPHHKNTQ